MLGLQQSLAGMIAGLLLTLSLVYSRSPATSQQTCEAPKYLGICDPFVPGVIIGSQGEESIPVIDTWPDGPAEKAGVCPGDKIISINRIPIHDHTSDRIMEEIVSTTPAPITLEVRRGGQEMKFHFGRVRETTLAALSHQKYVLRRRLLSGARTGLVPADETADEVQDLSRFYDQIDRSVGFRLIDGLDVPQSTPEERLRELVATQYGGSEAGRSVGVTPLGFGENTYLPGFTAVLLKDPEEVLVDTVFPNSPAHHAGLLPGDQILEVSEHPVHGRSVEELSNLILKPDRQRQVVVEVRRGTARLTLTLQTVRTSEINLPSVFTRIDAGATSLNPDAYIIGFWALYADDPREAVVDELRYPSPAFDAGLHVGDRIQAINAVPIGQLSREELAKIFQNNSAHPLRVEILRLGNKMELRVMPVTYREAEARIGRKVTKIGSTPCHCPDV